MRIVSRKGSSFLLKRVAVYRTLLPPHEYSIPFTLADAQTFNNRGDLTRVEMREKVWELEKTVNTGCLNICNYLTPLECLSWMVNDIRREYSIDIEIMTCKGRR